MPRDIVYDMAVMELAERAAPPVRKLPASEEPPPVESLPIDPEPWFGGVVTSAVDLMSGSTKQGAFYYWSTGERVVAFHPAIEPPNSGEAAYSLWMAIHAPSFGKPRRPGRVTVGRAIMAESLRHPEYEDVSSVVEIVVAPTPSTDELAAACLAKAYRAGSRD